MGSERFIKKENLKPKPQFALAYDCGEDIGEIAELMAEKLIMLWPITNFAVEFPEYQGKPVLLDLANGSDPIMGKEAIESIFGPKEK